MQHQKPVKNRTQNKNGRTDWVAHISHLVHLGRVHENLSFIKLFLVLPIDLEYWPTKTVDCGFIPDFETLPPPSIKKKISEIQFESSEETPNLFGIETDAAFAMRFTSYFFVRAKGTYKIFMLLGQRDTGKIKMDDVEIFSSGQSAIFFFIS